MSHYMALPPSKLLYAQIAERDSLEAEVDNFWSGVLSWYFPFAEGFSIQTQKRPDPKRGVWSDVVVNQVRDEVLAFGTVLHVVCENKKRVSEGRTLEWTEAADQLYGYLKTARSKQSKRQIFYGAVAIGRYIRFYYINRTSPALVDLSAKPDGQPYEIKNEEEAIHAIIIWIGEEIRK